MAPDGSAARPPSKIVYGSRCMLQDDKELTRLAQSPECVLIRGETGTGKELAAEALWSRGPRAHKPLVTLNAATLSRELIESDLFGVAPRVATGVDAKRGFLSAADGGTLFLDEIGDMLPDVQVKLLRVLQEGTFRRVGSLTEEKVDVHFIFATHRDLAADIKTGRFREDLYYRVSAQELYLPPLRERREDIPLLARHFCTQLAGRSHLTAPRIDVETERLLIACSWPGNVRQLKNAIAAALSRSDTDALRAEHLPDAVREAGQGSGPTIISGRTRPPLASDPHYDRVLRRKLVHEVRDRLLHGGRVATLLETHRGGGKTLTRQLARYCDDMPVVWLKDYTAENTSTSEFYSFLTGSDAVHNQIEFGRWLAGQATEQGLLVVLFGMQGPEERLEEVAATVRSLLSEHRYAAFLIVGNKRLLSLRQHEHYSWYRLLPASSFIDVPDLTIEEAGELLALHQKPAERLPVLYAATGGHPWFLHELLCRDISEPEAAHQLIRYHLGLTRNPARHLSDPATRSVLVRLLHGEPVESLANPCIRHEPGQYAEAKLYFDGLLRWDQEGRTQLRCPAVKMLFERELGG